jgi:hypothetical protein
MTNIAKNISTLIVAGFLLLSLKIPAIATSEYEILFKEYKIIIEPSALHKNIKQIETLSDQFVEEHKEYKIAEIYIWNKELKTINNLLFKKTYIEATKTNIIAYPKFLYANPRAINVSKLEERGQKYIMIEQKLESIAYRMVIFIHE